MNLAGVSLTPDLLATAAAAFSILTVLFAAPLLLGCYVVVQRAGALLQLVWFGGLLMLLATALVVAALGLLALG